MFRPPSLLAPQIVLPLRILPQGSRGFYVRAHRALLPPHAPDMLTARIQAIGGAGTLTLLDFGLVGCSSPRPPGPDRERNPRRRSAKGPFPGRHVRPLGPRDRIDKSNPPVRNCKLSVWQVAFLCSLCCLHVLGVDKGLCTASRRIGHGSARRRTLSCFAPARIILNRCAMGASCTLAPS